MPESPAHGKTFGASPNNHKRAALGSVDPNTPSAKERYVCCLSSHFWFAFKFAFPLFLY